jgi:hypothetical protein
LEALRLWDFELLADRLDSALLDFSMARHAGYLPVLGVEPDAVRASLTIKNAEGLAKVALQAGELHA